MLSIKKHHKFCNVTKHDPINTELPFLKILTSTAPTVLENIKNYVFTRTGPLFTKKTPSYRYRDPHYKPKTVWRPSRVYNGNPYTDKMIRQCLRSE